MPTRNVNLTPHYDQFVDAQIRSGRFQNASEVFRAGLNLLEESETEKQLKEELLRQAIEIGAADLDEGRSIDFEDRAAFRAAIEAKLAKLNNQ